MAQIQTNSSLAASIGSSSAQKKETDALQDVNLDDFLKLMITELQNQDPLNPLENDQLISQIGELRSIAATDKLSSTLDAALLGQNLASATNLIGANIDGISEDGQRVSGIVERVSVAEGTPTLHLEQSPFADYSTEKGEIEAGRYEYRVVWRDRNGQPVGVDPLMDSQGNQYSIETKGEAGVDQSILISNLPVSTGAKEVYRRRVGEADFKLVGTITDGKKATFLDTLSTAKLSGYVMPAEPSLIKGSKREFQVALKNVGEIKPPPRTVTTPTDDATDDASGDATDSAQQDSQQASDSTATDSADDASQT
jgi:flagellar basal-body rod modification protein FlgD